MFRASSSWDVVFIVAEFISLDIVLCSLEDYFSFLFVFAFIFPRIKLSRLSMYHRDNKIDKIAGVIYPLSQNKGQKN